jgi:hypothetical protein
LNSALRRADSSASRAESCDATGLADARVDEAALVERPVEREAEQGAARVPVEAVGRVADGPAPAQRADEVERRQVAGALLVDLEDRDVVVVLRDADGEVVAGRAVEPRLERVGLGRRRVEARPSA